MTHAKRFVALVNHNFSHKHPSLFLDSPVTGIADSMTRLTKMAWRVHDAFGSASLYPAPT